MELVTITPKIPHYEINSDGYLFALLLNDGEHKFTRISMNTECRSHLTDCLHFLFERGDIKENWRVNEHLHYNAAGILLNEHEGQAYNIKDAKDRISLLFYPGTTNKEKIERFEKQFAFYIHKIEEKNGFKKTEIYKTSLGMFDDDDYDDDEGNEVEGFAYVLVPDPRWYADTILFSIYTLIVKLMRHDLEEKLDFWNSENINDRKDRKLINELDWDGRFFRPGRAAIWFPFILNNLEKLSTGERHILGFPAEYDVNDRYGTPFNIHGVFNFFEMLAYMSIPVSKQEYVSYPTLKQGTFFYKIITEAKAKGQEKEYNMNFIKE